MFYVCDKKVISMGYLIGLIADKYNTVSCNSVTPHVDVNFKLNVSVSGLFNNLAFSGIF